MSVPKSKILTRGVNATKGVVALADVKVQSPSQSQIINLTVHSDKKGDEVISTTDGGNEETQTGGDVKPVYPSTFDADNPYSNLKTAKLDQDGTYTPESRIEELQAQIQDQSKIVEALSLIIELLESNPLIVNRYVIAKMDLLQELIMLLTGGENVEILVTDIECGCSASKAVNPIERIYVTKGGEILQLKYNFPDALRMLETHRISTKFTY